MSELPSCQNCKALRAENTELRELIRNLIPHVKFQADDYPVYIYELPNQSGRWILRSITAEQSELLASVLSPSKPEKEEA